MKPLRFALIFAATWSGFDLSRAYSQAGLGGTGVSRPASGFGDLDEDAIDETGSGSATRAGETSARRLDDPSMVIWESTDTDGAEEDVESLVGVVRVEDIVQPPSRYRYAAFGRPDPFLPPKLSIANPVEDPKETSIVSILQQYPLGDLQVVGLWKISDGQRKALVMTPSGEGVISRIGDLIGQSSGKITEINLDHIVVREFSVTGDGTRIFEDRVINLGNPENASIPSETVPVASAIGEAVQVPSPGAARGEAVAPAIEKPARAMSSETSNSEGHGQ